MQRRFNYDLFDLFNAELIWEWYIIFSFCLIVFLR